MSDSTNPYETQKLVDEYLLFHYASEDEILPYGFGPKDALNFAARTVSENTDVPRARALDLGCAVGRSSFELSRFCDEVIGIDYSAAFIRAAGQIRSGENLAYNRLEEAHVKTRLTACLPKDTRPERVSFETGDAMHLRADLGSFDLVHAANLLCRLPEPARLLARLPELVNPGGTLILTTPCTWLVEYTPKENWPSGSTFDWLQEALSPAFSLENKRDMPFLIRETARKFQWTVALGSIWTRN
jgi:putative 4-mercaptohistidine N1-methyltranferase